jgi:hypothetical protein
MNKVKNALNSHQWNRYVALRAVLALGTLVSMVLASGAGGYWN